jgi:hypothetical protein
MSNAAMSLVNSPRLAREWVLEIAVRWILVSLVAKTLTWVQGNVATA